MTENRTTVLTDRTEDGRWTITLAAPERRNALDASMVQQLTDAVAAVAADCDARSLVVAGQGAAFCAGADLPDLFGRPGSSVADTRDRLHQVYESFLAVRRLSIPSVAAVQGPAVGAGLNLAMSCDVRIAAPDARFIASFTRIGLHPGGGCTWFLVDTLGPQRALALLLDGGEVRAEEAVRHGLALEIADDPLAAAHERAARWAALDRQLVADIRTAVAVADRDGFEASLQFESWAQASSAGKPEIQAAVERFRR